MEQGQIDHINANLAGLIENTTVNVMVLAILQGKGMISNIDREIVEAKPTASEKANELYKIMKTKENGYIHLIRALRKTNQSGAYNILLYVSSKMIKKFRFGKSQTVGGLLSSSEVAEIETLINNGFYNERQEIYETILNQKKEVDLLRDTIPQPYSLYIPRHLSRRHSVDLELLQNSKLDIFVFKNIELPKLRDFLKHGRAIDSSTIQLGKRQISAKFILLKQEEHWKKICEKTKSSTGSTHLLRYENETQSFVVEATSGVTAELRQCLKNKGTNNPEEISEDAFLDKILTDCEKGVCICDVPGMGKSMLLASIARKLCKKYSNRVAVFIELQNLVLPKVELTCEQARSIVVEQASALNVASHILNKIIQSNREIKLDLFFDALDEVKDDEIDKTTKLFCTIFESFPQARIFVTSRPVVRDKLEESVGVIAYDIVGFNEATQQQYLISCWKNNEKAAILNNEKLKKYANACLRSFKANLKSSERDIAGIPLQCYLIAEVYSETAKVYAGSKEDVPLELYFEDSLSEIYSKFMLRQLGEINCNFKCMFKRHLVSCENNIQCQVRSFHIWVSIQLIFPRIAGDFSDEITDFENLTETNKLQPGLLKKREDNSKNKAEVEFVHRTFAEYLVAEYFANAVFLKPVAPLETKTKSLQQRAFDQIFQRGRKENLMWGIDAYRLREQVVAFFLNVLLAKIAGNTMDIQCVANIADVESFLENLEGCMLEESVGLLNVYLKAIENTLEKAPKKDKENFGRFLRTIDLFKPQGEPKLQSILVLPAVVCNQDTVQRICEFFQDNFHLNLMDLQYNYRILPIRMAIKRGDYELVKYFTERMPLGEALGYCVENTYNESEELVIKKLDIAAMLLEKDKTLLEQPSVLANQIHLRAIKFLVDKNADFQKIDYDGRNIIYNASEYMSAEDFITFCGILFTKRHHAWNYFLKPQQLQKCLFYWPDETKYKTKFLVNLLQYLSTDTRYNIILTELLGHFDISDVATILKNVLPYFSIQGSSADIFENLKTFLKPEFYEKYKEIFSILFVAVVYEGFTDILELLHRFDSQNLHANMTVQISEQIIPLLFVARSGEVLQFLVGIGGNIFEVDQQGRTILHFLPKWKQYKVFHDVVKYLGTLWSNKAFTPDISLSDTTKPRNLKELFNWPKIYSLETPLHCALREEFLDENRLDRLELFLKGGNTTLESGLVVNVNATDSKGYPVFELRSGVLPVIKHLVSHGLEVKAVKDMYGCNLTHRCAQRGILDHLNLFVELGVDVNELDFHGDNALQCGLVCIDDEDLAHGFSDFIETFQALLDAGVNTFHANFEGKLAYDIVKMKLEVLAGMENKGNRMYDHDELMEKDWLSFLKKLKPDSCTDDEEYLKSLIRKAYDVE